MSLLEHTTREFYRRIGVGDIAGILDLMSDQIQWSIPGPVVIPYAGTFLGKTGVAEFFRVLFEHEELRSFVPERFIFDETAGIACVLGSETAVALTTGKTFSTVWAEVFHVSNGLITTFQEHIDTYALAAAYSTAHEPN